MRSRPEAGLDKLVDVKAQAVVDQAALPRSWHIVVFAPEQLTVVAARNVRAEALPAIPITQRPSPAAAVPPE
jgi:hypothetical protein